MWCSAQLPPPSAACSFLGRTKQAAYTKPSGLISSQGCCTSAHPLRSSSYKTISCPSPWRHLICTMNVARQWTITQLFWWCSITARCAPSPSSCRQEEVIAGPFGASRCCCLPGLQDEHYLQTLQGRPFVALVEGSRNLAGKRKEHPHPFVWLGDQCQEALWTVQSSQAQLQATAKALGCASAAALAPGAATGADPGSGNIAARKSSCKAHLVAC